MFLDYFVYFSEIISLQIISLFKSSVNPTLLATKYTICGIFSPAKNIAIVYSLYIFANIIEDITLCFSLTRSPLHINIVCNTLSLQKTQTSYCPLLNAPIQSYSYNNNIKSLPIFLDILLNYETEN
jgi:hypothetical protein